MKILLKDSDLFFEKERPKLERDIIQAAALIAVFSVLTTVTFYVGWIDASLSIGALNALIWITGSMASGFAAVTLVFCVIAYRKISKKSLADSLFIMAHASTPVMLLGWAPHSVVKIIVIIWTVVFMKVGLQVYSKKSKNEASIIAVLIGLIALAISALTEFYLVYYI